MPLSIAIIPHSNSIPPPPQFETFGGPAQPGVQFDIGFGLRHPRFWFLNKEGTELLQFQADKLIHNWRQVDGQPGAEYPRYETIVGRFSEEVTALAGYMN